MKTTNQLIRSPFKFLNAYESSDKAIFFGREKEIEQLYESVSKNRLVLIYGESGTGKTSLVQCGLANRFEASDWVPFFIRRGNNINQSLYSTLSNSKAIGGFMVDDTNSLDTLSKMSERYLRPVYLIFDQFEELVILGSEEEQRFFIKTIKDILESELSESIHLLFIIREEYLAWLDDFEIAIPSFLDRRVRVESMRPSKLQKVVLNTCQYFNIKLEKEAENAQQIIRNLRGKGGIPLPYVQVYLDMLWKEDFERTYPNGWSESSYPELEFTTQEIDSFGKMEDVLERFLSEQMLTLRDAFLDVDETVDNNLSQHLLDSLVTEEGTKKVIYFERIDEQVHLLENSSKFLATIPGDILTFAINHLEKNRLLSVDENSFELAHDSLAKLIDRQRTDEQRLLYDVEKGIKTGTRMYPKTGDFLSLGQLELYRPHLSQLNLEDTHRQFILDSTTFHEQEQNRKEKELVAERALKETAIRNEKKAVKNNRLAWFISFIAIILGGAAFWFYNESTRTSESSSLAAKASSLSASNATQAVRISEIAHDTKQTNPSAQLVLHDIVSEFPVPFYQQIIYDSARIKAVEFHPTKPIFAVTALKAIKIYNTKGLLINHLTYSEEFTDLKFSPDGNYLVASSINNHALLWDIKNENSIELKGHLSDVVTVAASKDFILTGSWDKTVRLWNWNGEFIHQFNHINFISAVAFIPNSNRFLVGDWEGNIYLCDVNGQQIEQFKDHGGQISAISAKPDGSAYIAASWDKILTQRDFSNASVVKYRGHKSDVTGLKLYSGQDKFVSIADDNKVIVWNDDGTIAQNFSGHKKKISAVALSADDRYMVTVDEGGVIKIRDLRGLEEQRFFNKKGNNRNAIFSTIDSIFITSTDKTIYVWDKNGRLVREFPTFHKANIARLALSKDGKKIASVGGDAQSILWSLEGDTLKKFKGFHSSNLQSVIFSQNDSLLYTAGWGGKIAVWNIATGDTVATIDPDVGHVHSIEFSPDNKYLLCAGGFGRKGAIEIRATENNDKNYRFDKIPVIEAKFHPDRKTIISADEMQKKVKFWDYQGNLIWSFDAHERGINCFAISPDGLYLVTAGKDKVLKHWSIENKKPLLLTTYRGIDEHVIDVSFIDNGNKILTASADGITRIWLTREAFLASEKVADLTPNELIELGLKDSSEIDKNSLIIFPKVDRGNTINQKFIGWTKRINDYANADSYLYTFQGLQPLAIQGHTVNEKIYLQQLNIDYIEKTYELDNDIWEGDYLYSVIRAFTYANMVEFQIVNNNLESAIAYAKKGAHPKYDEKSLKWYNLKVSLLYLVNNQWKKAKKIIEPLMNEEIGGNLSFPANSFNQEKYSRSTTFKEVLLNDIDRLSNLGVKHENLVRMKAYLIEN